MLTIFVHQDGITRQSNQIEAAWLAADSGVRLWVDLADASPEEAATLTGTFGFHELSVEDALSAIHHPKVEEYPGYLYVILHGIDFEEAKRRFATHDVDFFLNSGFLVTVHDGTSRSVARVREVCSRSDHVLGEGTAAVFHRVVDQLVDHYRPEVERLEAKLDALEERVFEGPSDTLTREILALKRDVTQLRRVATPQRDVVGRLARREFPVITEQTAYRFRDVYDQFVRLTEEALTFQDRITGVLDAYLTSASNRLSQIMKVMTVIATIFMPLTVLSSMYGMNVTLPGFPGGAEAQFWWVLVIMAVVAAVMLWLFKRVRWI